MAGKQAKFPYLGGVVFGLEAQTHFDAIEQLADALTPHLIPDAAARLTALVLARETLASTYLGYDCALPHARMPDPAPFCVAVGFSREPIPWGGSGNQARLVFLSMVPSSCATDYLGFVRSLAQLLRNEPKRTELLSCVDSVSFEQQLRRQLLSQAAS